MAELTPSPVAAAVARELTTFRGQALRCEDAQQARLAADFIAVAMAPHGLTRSGRPEHLTASAAVLNPSGHQVLLVLHGKLRRWLQPGGHVEAVDVSLADAAVREVVEETGLRPLEVGGLLRLDCHPAPCAPPGTAWHDDAQILLIADADAPVVSAESHDVRWFPVEALPDDADDALRALVAAAVVACRSKAVD